MTKFLVIGRHKFTDIQTKLLQTAGLKEEVKRLDKVENVNDVVAKARELGVEAIVVQALPMHLLAQLLQMAQRAGIRVYAFRIEAVSTVPINAQCPPEADIEVPDPRSGNKRCSRTRALQLLKRIIIEAEDVATA